MDKTAWEGFKAGAWQTETDVAGFVRDNYTGYDGDESFLKQATKRTKDLWAKVEELARLESKRGGVLDIDVTTPISLLSHRPGYIDKKNELIVGLQTDAPLKRGINPFGGIRMVQQSVEEYGHKMSQAVLDQFKYRTTHNDGVFRLYNNEMRSARKCGVITGLPDAYGRGRLIGDYRRVALYGLDYLMREKNEDKERLSSGNLPTETIMLVEDISKQISFMAEAIKVGAEYGLELNRPARNAHEAVQWLYFGYLCSVKEQNGAANSIGRISAFLDIYIQRDLVNGVITEERAQELIDDFVIKLRMVRHLRTNDYNDLFAGDPTWVTISEGGVSLNGKHMITKTSYRILHTLYNLGPSPEPNLTILWSPKLPRPFKDFCAKISIETDSIQYENDEIMTPDYGDDYSISCCVSALKNGKQMQYFGARCNLAKLLLMALNGGRDELSGAQVGPEGETFEEGLLDYNKVMDVYKKYRSYLARLYVNTMNMIHFSHDKYAYERFTMSMYDSEVERLMAFGICGLSVLADSFSAIKHAKVYAIKNKDGIIDDFRIEGDFPKYGNDDDRVDNIAKWLVEDFYKELIKTPCYRGARHTLSVLTITSNVVYGKKTGSTPDGRKLGEPFSPGANPMHQRDLSGALASLNSVAKLDYKYAKDGISNTFTVTPDVLGKTLPDQIGTLVGVLDGYFAQNAHHLNVNVLNRAMLEEAMENPEKYPLLTIRVSGYAVRFNKLNKHQQKEVIGRTFHNKM
jgi:formate C-acetyltransferase